MRHQYQFVLLFVVGEFLARYFCKEFAWPSFAGFDDLYKIFDALHIPLEEGFIVNLGAKWIDNWADKDESWLFYTDLVVKRGKPFKLIGWDPSTGKKLEETNTHIERSFTKEQQKLITFINDYALPHSVNQLLHENSVPANFLLLKVDIDSIDLHVTHSILKHRQPEMIFAEFSQWNALPLEFASIYDGPDHHPQYYQGYRGFNDVWPCGGTSLAAWDRFATLSGYVVLTTDGRSNVIMIKAEAAKKWLKITSSQVKQGMAAAAKESEKRLKVPGMYLTPKAMSQAVKLIEKRCMELDTPYVVAFNGTCLCPDQSTLCRCVLPVTE
mmetsp:Transcript_19323/g.32309  ORF Transcript_19323/g.32309 Transcript_19323/m.32309 type:complete len:326 (-) Transcript_19323:698-1675(-)